jgi:hypothetical protein
MANTTTPNLALSLPTPGTSEPFSVSAVNTNFTKIDTYAGTTTTAISTEVTNRTNAVSAEATARTNADNALDARLDVLEARPKIYVQATDPVSGMVAGDLRFW